MQISSRKIASMLKTLDVEDAPQLPKNKDNSPPGRGSKQEKKQRALGQSSTRSADRPASDASSRRARHRKKPKVSTRNRNAGPRPARGARPAAGGRPRLQQVPAARAREAPAPDAEAGKGCFKGSGATGRRTRAGRFVVDAARVVRPSRRRLVAARSGPTPRASRGCPTTRRAPRQVFSARRGRGGAAGPQRRPCRPCRPAAPPPPRSGRGAGPRRRPRPSS